MNKLDFNEKSQKFLAPCFALSFSLFFIISRVYFHFSYRFSFVCLVSFFFFNISPFSLLFSFIVLKLYIQNRYLITCFCRSLVHTKTEFDIPVAILYLNMDVFKHLTTFFLLTFQFANSHFCDVDTIRHTVHVL